MYIYDLYSRLLDMYIGRGKDRIEEELDDVLVEESVSYGIQEQSVLVDDFINAYIFADAEQDVGVVECEIENGGGQRKAEQQLSTVVHYLQIIMTIHQHQPFLAHLKFVNGVCTLYLSLCLCPYLYRSLEVQCFSLDLLLFKQLLTQQVTLILIILRNTMRYFIYH